MRARPSRRRAGTPRSSRSMLRARRRAERRCTSRSSRTRTRDVRLRAPTRSSRRASPKSTTRTTIRTPTCPGKGRAALEAAGIRVVVGEGEAEARRINEAYIKHRTTGLPFVIAKFAASLDGKIAATSGDSRWVSGPETRAWAHDLRTRIDAIAVGVNTVLVDDPQLTARVDDAPRGAAAVARRDRLERPHSALTRRCWVAARRR